MICKMPDEYLRIQEEIDRFISVGDLRRAKACIDEYCDPGTDNPQRYIIFRAHPALTAMAHGAPDFALDVIDGVGEELLQDYDCSRLLNEVYEKWDRGVPLTSIPRTCGELIFRRVTLISVRRRCEVWRANIHDFHSRIGRGNSAYASLKNLADQLGDEFVSLLSTPTHILEDDQIERKSELISHVDPLNSDLGLKHSDKRWILGRIDGDWFVPIQRTDMDSVPLPISVRGANSELGEYMAVVPVGRDGRPNGPVARLRPAGNGRPIQELMGELTHLRERGE